MERAGRRKLFSSIPCPACLSHIVARQASAIAASSAPLRSIVRRSVSSSPNRQERTEPSAVSLVRSHASQKLRVTDPMMPTVAGPPSTSHSSAGADGSSRPAGVSRYRRPSTDRSSSAETRWSLRHV